MGHYRIFHAEKRGQIGVFTPELELLLLSLGSAGIVKRAQLAVNGDIGYAMEIGPYWGIFPGNISREGLLIMDPGSLAILGKFPLFSPFLPRANVGITPESFFIWREEELLAEIALEDLRVKRNIDIRQWSDGDEVIDLSISHNARVAALVTIDLVVAWDLRTNETIYHNEDSMGHLLLNPQGTHLALGDRNGRGAEILDLKTGIEHDTAWEDGRPTFIEWSLAGDLLTLNGRNSKMYSVWNTQGEEISNYIFPGSIDSVAWTSNEELALAIVARLPRKDAEPTQWGLQVYFWNVRQGNPPRLLYPP